MTQHPVALAIALALSVAVALPGCDSTANLTEQEHIQRAKDFEDKGNLKASIVELKNAIQKNPDSPQARLLIGQIYLKAGMGAEAEKELSQAAKLGVNPETIKPQLGKALLLMGEYKRLLDEVQASEQTSKANLARVLQLRADALFGLGMIKEACGLFQQSLDTTADNPPTLWGLAQCAVVERDMTKARKWLDAALKIKDEQPRTWMFIGDWEQLNRNPRGALSAYTSALKSEPGNIDALWARARLNLKLGQLKPAQIDIDKIHELAPQSLAAKYLQASLSFKEKKYAEARDALQASLEINRDYLPALLLGASIEFALGNLETAESHIRHVLQAAPSNINALQWLAVIQLNQGRPDDAEKTIAPIDLEKTKNVSIYVISGEIAQAKKEFAKAAAYFEKAAELSPTNAAIRTELGVSRLVQGETRAIADLQAASSMEGAGLKADNIIILNQLNQKQFDAALASIAALEKKQPQSPLTWNYRGTAYLGKKETTKARDSFNQALKLDLNFFPAAVNLAQLDLVDGKAKDARAHFENIIKADPSHLQAMLALADFNLFEKDEAGYMNWLNKAVKAHPQAMLPRIAMTRFLLHKGEKNKALDVAREAVNTNPDNPLALKLLGETQLNVGDKANAIITFTTLVKKSNQSLDAYLLLANAQIANKKFNDARVNLGKALQINPNYLQSQEALLRLEMIEDKPEAALKIARQIQLQEPQSPLGFEREADVHYALKHLPQAIKAYEQALTKGSGVAVLIKLHRVRSAAGDTKAAEQHLVEWIKQHPTDLAARTYAAEVYMLSNRNREAISQYEVLLKSSPNNVSALNNLASLYQYEKDSRAAVTAERALKIEPENPRVQDTLGWILVEQGQLPRGLELLRKAATSTPRDATVRYHYGVALARSGKKPEARKELEAAIANGQRHPDLEEARALLKSL
jgi:putative PEP-CTERM system TPR-repeat lipoprotein